MKDEGFEVGNCSKCGKDLKTGYPYGQIGDDSTPVYIRCRYCGFINNYMARVEKWREEQERKSRRKRK